MNLRAVTIALFALLPLHQTNAQSVYEREAAGFNELDMAAGGCESKLKSQNAILVKAKTLLDQRGEKIQQLEQENQQLQSQLQSGQDNSNENAGKLAIYASQLKGQLDALTAQLAQEKSTNQSLNQQITQLKLQLSNCGSSQTGSASITPDSSNMPVLSGNNSVISGGIQFELKSVRQSNSKTLAAVLSMTNLNHEKIFGTIIGPAPTLLDDQGGLWKANHRNHFGGISRCTQRNAYLTGDRAYCMNLVPKKTLLPTQLFKNTPLVATVNFASSTPIGVDKPKTVSLTATLMLWKGGDNFEFIPVNIQNVPISL